MFSQKKVSINRLIKLKQNYLSGFARSSNLKKKTVMMDIVDVKDMIRSILTSSKSIYNVPKLMKDFKAETGQAIPLFGFKSVTEFLMSLTDTLRITGVPPYEEITLIASSKSSHISSLVKRQSSKLRGPYKMQKWNQQQHQQFFSYWRINNDKKNDDFAKSNSISQFSSKEMLLSEQHPQKNQEFGNSDSDFIFKEDDITNLHSIKPSASCPSKLYCLPSTELKVKAPFQNSCIVSEVVCSNLKKLIQKQQHGIWCRELPEIYFQLYNVTLDFREYGYHSMIEMVMALNEIFRYIRPDNGDWLLFDASKPPSEDELKLCVLSTSKVPDAIQENILKLVETHSRDSPRGIYLEDFLVLYFKKYHEKLNFRRHGFPNIRSLLDSLRCRGLKFFKVENRCLIQLHIEETSYELADFGDAVQLTPDDALFLDLFPEDVVKPNEKFTHLDIEEHFSIGKVTEVCIAEIWSPARFYVIPKINKLNLDSVMENLQYFYNTHGNKYSMPVPAVQRNQICVGKICAASNGPEEWHRCLIQKVIDNQTAMVKLVDFGTLVKVEKKNLKFMHYDFLYLPCQAIQAKLYNVKPKNECDVKFPFTTSKRFLELVAVPFVEIFVTGLQNTGISGEVYIASGENRISVNQILICEGIAISKQESELSETELEFFRRNMLCKKEILPEVDAAFDELKAPANTNNFTEETGDTKMTYNNNSVSAVNNSQRGEISLNSIISSDNLNLPSQLNNDDSNYVRKTAFISQKNETDSLNSMSLKTADCGLQTGEKSLKKIADSTLFSDTEIKALSYALLSHHKRLREVGQIDFECAVNSSYILAQQYYLQKEKNSSCYGLEMMLPTTINDEKVIAVSEGNNGEKNTNCEKIAQKSCLLDLDQNVEIPENIKKISIGNIALHCFKVGNEGYISLNEIFTAIPPLSPEKFYDIMTSMNVNWPIKRIKKSLFKSDNCNEELTTNQQIMYKNRKSGASVVNQNQESEDYIIAIAVDSFSDFLSTLLEWCKKFSALCDGLKTSFQLLVLD